MEKWIGAINLFGREKWSVRGITFPRQRKSRVERKTKMNESSTKDGVKEVTLESWVEFFGFTNKYFSEAPMLIYRGQANYYWPLESSLDRLQKRYSFRKSFSGANPSFFTSPPLSPEQHLNAFKRALRGRRGLNPQPLIEEDDYWALGQHHGLATPLLDLTRSPYVALFFAFEHEKIILDDKMSEPEYRGVYALSAESIMHDKRSRKCDSPVRIISPNSDDNFRLISQEALFAKLPQEIDLESYISKHFSGEKDSSARFYKIKIPNKDRDDCLGALNKMNINYMTLFPDIDGAARHVNSLWQPGHEDSIAYV